MHSQPNPVCLHVVADCGADTAEQRDPSPPRWSRGELSLHDGAKCKAPWNFDRACQARFFCQQKQRKKEG